jgi:dihydroflavonol-4-reductase
MRTLVTGAAGLIGSHLVRTLCELGHDVRALVRPSSRRDALAGLPVEFVTADVMQMDDRLLQACIKCDVVFHAAAHFTYRPDSEVLHSVAVTGTENVLKAAAKAGVSRVVVTSSSVVFGYTNGPLVIDETARMTGGSHQPPYVEAKIAQHQRALALADRLGVSIVLACPTITVGPTMATLGPSNGIIAAYLNDPFRCTFPGGCNIVAARDVAMGHVVLAKCGSPGESYLLGSENLTWQQIHTRIADLTGIRQPIFELNHTTAYLASTAEELRARLEGRAPLSTREQATMVGRYYWYSHLKAAQIGYAPCAAQDALIEAISWLVASPHVNRETRAGLHLAPDIHRFRAAMRAAAPMERASS